MLLPEGRETTVIAHEGKMYRVDVLDRVFGSALGKHTPGLDRFARRVFSLGPSTLFDHWGELKSGARCDEAIVEDPLFLPLARQDAVVLEIDVTDRRFTRVEGPLRGSGAARPRIKGSPLAYTPAVAIVLGEEVFAPKLEDAAAAIIGVSLAILWGVDGTRDFGAHVGPLMQTPTPDEVVVESAGTRLRVPLELGTLASLVARAARIVPRVPGDLLLLPVAPQRPAPSAKLTLSSAGMGVLAAT